MTKPIIDNIGLQKLVEEISIKYFNKSFQHKATFNSRLRTTAGRCMYYTNNIEMNYRFTKVNSLETEIGVIKHELCHYHLKLAGKNPNHNSKDFKTLLDQVGGLHSHFKVNNNGLKPRKPKPYKYFYQCTNCGKCFARKEPITYFLYVCHFCKSKIKPITEDEFIQNKDKMN